MAKIYLVAGKGGSGKSLFTLGLLDYLHSQNEKILLIDSDTRSSDVSKACHNIIDHMSIDLNAPDGWLALVDFYEHKPDHCIVINTVQLSNRAIHRDSFALTDTLQKLNRDLETFWLINRQIDSFDFLKDFKQAFAGTKIHVVKNHFFGDDFVFNKFKNSTLMKEIFTEGGKLLSFPKLNLEICDEIFDHRLFISFAAKSLASNLREELNTWRSSVKNMFEVANGG